MKIDTSVVPFLIRKQLEAHGRDWAQQTFEDFQEQGTPRADWTRGQWCGDTSQLDAIRNEEGQNDANRTIIESVIDDAATQQWEWMWDAADTEPKFGGYSTQYEFACRVAGEQIS